MRTATPTARGSSNSVRTTPIRTARSASRAATACGGGSANSGRTRPSPSGPSPCGGGAASASVEGCSSVVSVDSAPFSAREAGRASAPGTLMCWMLAGGPSRRAGCRRGCSAARGGSQTPNRVLAQDLDEPCAGKSGADLCGFYGIDTDRIYRRIGGFRVVVMQNMPKRGRNAILKRFGGRLDRRSVAGLRSCTMRGP